MFKITRSCAARLIERETDLKSSEGAGRRVRLIIFLASNF
jgi:hypothetical protein